MSTLSIMWLRLLLYQLTILFAKAQNDCIGRATFRSPANSDIGVTCGSQSVSIQILLCPLYFSGYNESLLSLNSQHSKPECKGVADWTVDPPVLNFNISINDDAISACSTQLTVSEEIGSGVFADFSSVQYINISGAFCTKDPTVEAITYSQEVMYRFSCRYPLQYLVNNTQMSVSGTTLAVKDTNGSFISTLSMLLYADNSYSDLLTIPSEGLELKTRVFVEVKASNLTSRFHVLLDRCYATTSPFHSSADYFDLFIGCNRDGQTVIDVNGEQQQARFSFEVFRFTEHTDSAKSIYYIHCATRLCVNTICPTLIQNCTSSRRRRSTSANNEDTTVSDMRTVTSIPIRTKLEGNPMGASGSFHSHHSDGTIVAVSIIAGIVGLICLVLVAFIIYHMYYANISVNKTILYTHE